MDDLSTHLQENVSGVQVVRALAREGHEISRIGRANRTLFTARIKVNHE